MMVWTTADVLAARMAAMLAVAMAAKTASMTRDVMLAAPMAEKMV